MYLGEAPATPMRGASDGRSRPLPTLQARERAQRDSPANGCLGQNWVARAAHLPGRTLHLAVLLHFLVVRQRTSSVELSNTATIAFGLDRNAKYRALVCLEIAGLVEVKRRPGRSPIVRVLERDMIHANAL